MFFEILFNLNDKNHHLNCNWNWILSFQTNKTNKLANCTQLQWSFKWTEKSFFFCWSRIFGIYDETRLALSSASEQGKKLTDKTNNHQKNGQKRFFRFFVAVEQLTRITSSRRKSSSLITILTINNDFFVFRNFFFCFVFSNDIMIIHHYHHLGMFGQFRLPGLTDWI